MGTDTLVTITRWDTMKAALRRMINSDEDCRIEMDGFFLQPGELLGKAHVEDDARIKWDEVTQIARDLAPLQI